MTNIEVEQAITEMDLLSIPLGTAITVPDYGEYTYLPDGWANATGDNSFGHDEVRNWLRSYAGRVKVAHVGTMMEVETLTQYKQRFRTIVIGRACASGVSRTPVRQALRVLDVEDPVLRLGMWVHTRDENIVSILPGGTLAVTGDPEDFARFGVFRWGGGSFVPLMGGVARPGWRCFKVVGFPEGTHALEWPDEVPGEGIREFKERALEIGDRTRSDHSWCGDYQNAMGRAGISQFTLSEHVHVGMPLRDVQDRAALPLGTEARGNSLWTRTEAGWERGDGRVTHPPDWMPRPGVRITSIPSPRVGEPVTFEAMGEVPVGSIMTQGSQWWVKTADLMWQASDHNGAVLNTYGYVPASFGLSDTLVWHRFGPGDKVERGDGPAPGFMPRSVDEIREAPLGTTLVNAGTTTDLNRLTYVKRGDGWARLDGIGGGVPSGNFNIHNYMWGPPREETTGGTGTGATIGEVLDRTQQLALPDGALMYYPPPGRNDAQWCFIGRRGGTDYETVNIFGPNSGHYSDSLRLLWDGTGEMHIPVERAEWLTSAPVGTVAFSGPEPGTTRWVKRDDEQWHSDGGSHRRTLVVNGRLEFRSIGGWNTPVTQTGEVLTGWQVSELPDGAIVIYEYNNPGGDRWVMYGRTRSHGIGESGTRRVAHVNGAGEWNPEGNRVLWDGTGDMEIAVRSVEEMRAMPVGTIVGQGPRHRATTWTKEADGCWVGNGGSHTADTFYLDPLAYIHIPVPGVTA